MRDFFFNTAAGQPAFSEAVCIRAFEPSRPYAQNPQVIVYGARFQQLRAYYTRPVANTPHPNLPQVYFADDVQFQDRPGGLVEWTRAWTTLPTSWTDFESYPYSFPGVTLVRVPFTKTVTAKVVNDYFIVGNLAAFDNALVAYDDFSNAAWVKSSVVTVANATAIPACAGGNVAAASLTENAASAVIHYAIQGSGTNGAPPPAVFLKNGNANIARVALATAVTPDFNAAYATVDLRTGLTLANANAVPSVAAVGDGWWRIGLNNVVGSYANASLAVILCDDNGNTNYNSTGRTLYAWRGQVPNASGGTIPHATVPPSQTVDATNYPIGSADAIPVKFGTVFTFGTPNYGIANIAIEVISNLSTPNANTYYNGNASWVSIDQNNANSYSIEAQDSTLSLWQGAIWLRQRKYVKAR